MCFLDVSDGVLFEQPQNLYVTSVDPAADACFYVSPDHLRHSLPRGCHPHPFQRIRFEQPEIHFE
jgi:hypothetical protein